MYRKQSRLKQSDVAAIINLSQYASVSRWEKGVRLPSLEFALNYHLLFDIPIESLFERQIKEISEGVKERIIFRLRALGNSSNEADVSERMAFLNAALTRLTQLV